MHAAVLLCAVAVNAMRAIGLGLLQPTLLIPNASAHGWWLLLTQPFLHLEGAICHSGGLHLQHPRIQADSEHSSSSHNPHKELLHWPMLCFKTSCSPLRPSMMLAASQYGMQGISPAEPGGHIRQTTSSSHTTVMDHY